jgi:hypothetical protein
MCKRCAGDVQPAVLTRACLLPQYRPPPAVAAQPKHMQSHDQSNSRIVASTEEASSADHRLRGRFHSRCAPAATPEPAGAAQSPYVLQQSLPQRCIPLYGSTPAMDDMLTCSSRVHRQQSPQLLLYMQCVTAPQQRITQVLHLVCSCNSSLTSDRQVLRLPLVRDALLLLMRSYPLLLPLLLLLL